MISTYDNKKVIEKYSKQINILNLENNVDAPKSTNLGVYNAKFDKILIALTDKEKPNWRKDIYPEYKANRKGVRKPELLQDAINYLKLGFHMIRMEKEQQKEETNQQKLPF